MTRKDLRLFANTLTADDNYSLPNRGILAQHIQMHLSQKLKRFSQVHSQFFKSTLIFEHFEKK